MIVHANGCKWVICYVKTWAKTKIAVCFFNQKIATNVMVLIVEAVLQLLNSVFIANYRRWID